MTSLDIRADDHYLLYEQKSAWSRKIEVTEEFANRFRQNWKELLNLQDELHTFEKEYLDRQK